MAETQKGSFSGDLRALLESGEGADVTLVVGRSQLQAHSPILAARSPVFAAMLRNDMREARSRRVQINDVREAVLRQLLFFIYTDTAPQLQTVAAELLAAADKYDLPLLKKTCERQLARDLTVQNAAAAAGLAHLHRCPQLGSAAAQFIAAHREVLATDSWQQLLRDNAGATADICKQMAVTAIQPAPQVIPEEIKRKLGVRLLEAATAGKTTDVWTLLTAGAPKDYRDVNGCTALHLAADNCHTTTIKCLLTAGLDVNAVDSWKETPLHKAACKGDAYIIWLLVEASAKIDAQDKTGKTPLHVAAKRKTGAGDAQAVSALLLAGARKDIRDRMGRTPESEATAYTKCAFSTAWSFYDTL